MIRTLLIDDEPPARQLLREYLGAYPQVEILGEAGSGREAVTRINAEAPDLVFLDVQMPGLTGFEVLAQLDRLPHLIFCTAYDTYAVEAFEAGAVDYLLKPYTQARFRKAMDRVLKRLQDPPDPARLAALAQQAQPPNTGYLERLFVRAGDRVLPVDVQNVLWVEAAGDYARLHTAEAPYLTSLRLSTLAERLDPDRFVRVHRSSIVALPAIQHLTSDGDGGYVLTLTNRKRVRVSRSYAPVIRDLIT